MTASQDRSGDLAERAKALVQRADFAAAENLVRSTLNDTNPDPDQADALYVLAVAERYQEKFDEALATLDRLVAIDSGYSRAHQEKDHTLLEKQELEAAAASYEQAVLLNPSLLASWKALAGLYDLANQKAQSEHFEAQARFLAGLPPELQSVASMLHDGKLYKSERLCRHFLQHNKHHVEAMRLLAATSVPFV